MARRIGKLEDGRELWGYDFKDVEVKTLGEYEIEIIGSTGISDRDGEVINPDGWDLKNFKKNPVILPAHDYRAPAIARAKSVKIEDKKLKFEIEFPQDGIYPLADIYRKLYKSGFMKASSVGFVPSEWVNGDGEKEPYRTYLKQELLELSLVSVPVNPEALVAEKGISEAMAKGVINNDEFEILKQAIENGIKGGENDDDDGEKQSDSQTGTGEEENSKNKECKLLIEKPVEEDDKTIRIQIRDCEVTATITISADEGIKALYCGKVKKIRTYIFDKSKGWTVAKAKKWVEEHDEGKLMIVEIEKEEDYGRFKEKVMKVLEEIKNVENYRQLLFGSAGNVSEQTQEKSRIVDIVREAIKNIKEG